MTTAAPSCAKSRASAAPIPRAPPLISATLPASRAMTLLRARGENGFADQPRALVVLLGRLVAEREADVLLATLVREERLARRELHARLDRELRELLLVRAGRQLDPEKEP